MYLAEKSQKSKLRAIEDKNKVQFLIDKVRKDKYKSQETHYGVDLSDIEIPAPTRAIVSVAHGVRDLFHKAYNMQFKKRKQIYGAKINRDYSTGKQRARSYEVDNNDDIKDTLELNQWSSDISSKKIYEKHKNFVVGLSQKVTLQSDSHNKKISLEQQQNNFLMTLSNLSKRIEQPELSTPKVTNKIQNQKERDFWQRKYSSKQGIDHHSNKLPVSKEIAESQNEISEDLKYKEIRNHVTKNSPSTVMFNKKLLMDIASKKYLQREKNMMESIGNSDLNYQQKLDIAEDVIDSVLNDLGGKFTNLKRSGVLTNMKATSHELIKTLIDTSRTASILKNQEDEKKSSMKIGYLMYLRKRSWLMT